MRRGIYFAYGVAAYVGFLGAFLYMIGFIGNFLVPTTLDGPAEGSLWKAALINTLLVGLFAVQHTWMARPTFKTWWTKFAPVPIERPTYVLFTNIALVLMYWLWQPMGGVVWDVQNPIGRAVLYSLFGLGWLIVLVTTFLINHFDLFGLRQVWCYLRDTPCTSLGFMTPGPYKIVRHPLYVGWLTVFWATPTMGSAHLLFAIGLTVYVLVAIQFEERNLEEFHGEAYASYRRRVPMLIPALPGR
ncbi:MAG: hypothetical protein CMJ48_12130 [Planctomycetaceae bacterium]|nr:hypothetical protein [Planctomycetaceae bacterium]